jgi:uncharacterized protein YifE (UPF0438 family)/predicted nucleotidyltransferase
MLKDRILFTLKFFDLQNTPLTLNQLGNFLFNEPDILAHSVDSRFEIRQGPTQPSPVSENELLAVINSELKDSVDKIEDFYCLAGRTSMVIKHNDNEFYRRKREHSIRRFLPSLRFVPFVRGVGVGGSQTMGESKPDSDIDLFIILDPEFMWLGRILVTLYFQLSGTRRHGIRIANRFCLNHYLGGPKEVDEERDPYNAMEYLRLRPEVYPQVVAEFVNRNLSWIRNFFPQALVEQVVTQNQSTGQRMLESLFRNSFGNWINKQLGVWQMHRIRRGEPAVATQTELSFHSKPRKFELLTRVFTGK